MANPRVTEASRRTIAEILDALQETMDSFESVLTELEPADWHRPTGCPGWDVQDVVSHIIGLEDRLADLPPPDHELPEGLGHLRHDDARDLEIAVDYRRGMAPAEILRQFGESTARGMQLRRASTRDADEITDGPFGWKMPYWQLLSIRTFDCFAHEQDVRRAVGRPGNLDGEAAAVTRDLIMSFLPGVLPSRIETLADRTIALHITDAPISNGSRGSGGVTIDAGSAAPGAAPAATLRMPFGELVALVCGRADVDDTRISVSGDAPLGAQVLGALAITP